MDKTVLKQEMNKLCDMQIEHWNCLKGALEVFEDYDEKEICTMYQKYFRNNTEGLEQLIKVHKMIRKIEERNQNLIGGI